MTLRLFGTDGIRGRANTPPITPETIVKIGQAIAFYFRDLPQVDAGVFPQSLPYRMFNPYVNHSGHPFTVVVGKDTRLSGYMIESALVAGLVSQGAHVIMLGPLPTPAVAMLTRSLRAHVGIMITASHNPYTDNGIKFFDANGVKFSSNLENHLEEIIVSGVPPLPVECGKSMRLDDSAGRYVEFAKATFPKGKSLDGLKIVLDCANGAAYRVAPRIFWELGASVIPLADEPNGRNINARCGALHPENLQKCIQETQADLGIALDGDADRLVLVNSKGETINGDQILALVAKEWKKNSWLRGGVVSTEISNLGLKKYLDSLGISHFESAVGDKNVVALMQQTGANLGGEESGHLILSDYTTTGDGIIAALQVLNVVQESGRKLDDLFPVFQPYPQLTRSFPLKEFMTAGFLHQLRSKLETKLAAEGRVILRKSGTEPVLRVVIQSKNPDLLESITAEDLDAL